MAATNRFAWLDGLRAVAVALVLLGHVKLAFQLQLGGIGDIMLRVFNAHVGVQIFFVISGFIITLLLLREKDACGRINLKAFWRRRGFRILPALWLFLLALLLLQAFGMFSMTVQTWLGSLLFFRNHIGEGWFTGHLWSLGVEAQFYFLWPFFVVHLPIKMRYVVCMGGILLAISFRFIAATLAMPELSFYTLPGNLDLLMLGAMGAVYVSTQGGQEKIRQANRLSAALSTKSAWLILVTVSLASTFLMSTRWSSWAMIFEPMLIGALVTLLILHVHGSAQGVMRRILSYAPISLLGLWSYSLYLWQQLFLAPAAAWPVNSWMREYPLIWPFGLAVVTLASYYLIERRFNQWGHKSANK